MICRFCGKKTNTNGKCDCCSKESPVLLEYKSYENDPIVEKLSLLLESSDENNSNVDITENHHDNTNDLEITLSANIHKKDSDSDLLPNAIDEVLEECSIISEYAIKKQNQKEDNHSNKKRPLIRLVVISGGIVFLLSALVYASICVRNNQKDKSEISDESKMTNMTTIVSEEDVIDYTSTYNETSKMNTETTETADSVDSNFLYNNSENNALSFKGKYYSINNSDFSNNSSSDFINIFGTKPLNCTKELYLNESGFQYNNYFYVTDIEDNVVTLKNTDFLGIGEDFIELFNFNEITESDDYQNDDNKQNELYVFNISNRNVSATLICNKLNGLSYGVHYDEKDKKYNTLGGLRLFSISNNCKDSILWIEDMEGNTSIKTLYRDSVDVPSDISGDIVISKSSYGYEIARLSLAEEKNIYFYRDFNSQDVYMIQYIKCNTENDGNNGISDAVLRENEGGEVE